MTAVIYARYSSDNQREESIEGQIRECTAYAEKNGITVIKHYIDRAFSAKTDNRPEFQQMIKDSGKKLFDVVLVWKFDRFARNRFDSANYKMILKKNGVHLISVMEPIAEGSQGILVETLLEGMAEYYSAELSEKVIRGQTENALKGKCTGGTGTIGYKIDEEKFYHLDPLTSPLVLEVFQRYDNGDKMVEIVNFLNDKGVRNMLGGKMTHSSVNTMLKNRRYIGELSFRDIVVPDAIPAIVPKDLFDRVQKRMDKNKRAPACGKADEEYLLTTKLFCGKCGALMFGESGTSATGRTYYYYKCANVKRRKGCNKKTVQKDWIEDLVVRETMKLIRDDAVIDKIVQLVMDVQNQENTTIPLLEKQLREVNKKLDNLMKAIEDGLYTRTTKERLEALENQKDELTAKIADEKLKKPSFNEDFIRFRLMKFRKFDISQKKQRKALIEIFVNAIFLYDDRMLITFNYKDGTQTVRFEDTLTADGVEGKSSDLFSSAGPELFSRETEELFVLSGTFANNRAAVFWETAALFYTALFALCAEFRVLFQQGLEVLAGKAARHLGHLLRRTLGDDEPPALPPSGPRSMMWSAHLMRSRLCSMTMTVLPASTSFCSTSMRRWTSAMWRPVVGSSRIYTVLPVLRRASSLASLTRCASPPERVVALCPSVTYPRPTSNSVCSLRAIFGWLAKKTTASSTVMFSTSEMVFSLYLTSSVSRL